MDYLLSHIRDFYQLGANAQAALQENFEELTMAKNEFLVKEGRQCHHLYFVQQGAIRGYYTLDGKEITHWFGFESDFVTSFHSFITGKPSVENIQLMEGCIFWRISKEKLNTLFNRHQDIERLVRIAYEKYYIRLEERFVNSHFKTATELYENLLKAAPHIPERVPLGYIASYLGITQETLSRIRNRI